MYLFKRDLLNKICERTSSVASQAGFLINNTTLELIVKLGLDVSKESLEALIWEPAPLINNIKDFDPLTKTLYANSEHNLVLIEQTLRAIDWQN